MAGDLNFSRIETDFWTLELTLKNGFLCSLLVNLRRGLLWSCKHHRKPQR